MLHEQNLYLIPSPSLTREMDAAWWEDFLKNNNNFTQTIVMKDALTNGTVSLLESEVMAVLRNICNNRNDGAGYFRVYIDQVVLTKQEMEEHVFMFPPLPGEPVTVWAERAYPGKQFCMILNLAEVISEELAKCLTTLMQPLTDRIGIPLNGLHTTTFVGNYGFTPLGIHQDSPGGNVIHFHIGPGKKTMYNWEADEYNKLAGGRPNNRDVTPLLPFAKEFTFGKGDIYYMPWDKFHIGYSGELSIGVSVWFDNHGRDVILGQLLDNLKKKHFDYRKAVITKPVKEEDDNGFDVVTALMNQPEYLEEAPFVSLLEEEYQDHMLRLFSNGGWKISPVLSRQRRSAGNPSDVEWLLSSNVRITAPFRICYAVRNGGALKNILQGRGNDNQLSAVANRPYRQAE